MPAARGSYRVDLQNPVVDHPLTRQLGSWHLGLPHLVGGNRLWDLRNKAHGTITAAFPSTATSGWNPSGRNDGFGAVAFDGTDDVAVCDGISIVATPFSVASFVVARSTGNLVRFWSVGDGGSTRNMPHGRFTGTSQVTFGLWSDDLDATVNAYVNLWTLFVFTFSAANVQTVYQFNANGYLTTSRAAGGTVTTSTKGRIGNWAWDNSAAACLFGSHMVWPTRCLSESDASALYRETLTGYPNLLRRYPERSWFVLRESEAAAGGATIPVFAHHYRMQGIQ